MDPTAPRGTARGGSLLELLVALAVLSFALVGVAALEGDVMRWDRGGVNATQTAAAATQVLELLKL